MPSNIEFSINTYIHKRSLDRLFANNQSTLSFIFLLHCCTWIGVCFSDIFFQKLQRFCILGFTIEIFVVDLSNIKLYSLNGGTDNSLYVYLLLFSELYVISFLLLLFSSVSFVQILYFRPREGSKVSWSI